MRDASHWPKKNWVRFLTPDPKNTLTSCITRSSYTHPTLILHKSCRMSVGWECYNAVQLQVTHEYKKTHRTPNGGVRCVFIRSLCFNPDWIWNLFHTCSLWFVWYMSMISLSRRDFQTDNTQIISELTSSQRSDHWQEDTNCDWPIRKRTLFGVRCAVCLALPNRYPSCNHYNKDTSLWWVRYEFDRCLRFPYLWTELHRTHIEDTTVFERCYNGFRTVSLRL